MSPDVAGCPVWVGSSVYFPPFSPSFPRRDVPACLRMSRDVPKCHVAVGIEKQCRFPTSGSHRPVVAKGKNKPNSAATLGWRWVYRSTGFPARVQPTWSAFRDTNAAKPRSFGRTSALAAWFCSVRVPAVTSYALGHGRDARATGRDAKKSRDPLGSRL